MAENEFGSDCRFVKMESLLVLVQDDTTVADKLSTSDNEFISAVQLQLSCKVI